MKFLRREIVVLQESTMNFDLVLFEGWFWNRF